MPSIKINFHNIMFDPEVQNYCNKEDFKCPNYAHSWACPPETPFLEEVVSTYSEFYLIYYDFDLKYYIEENLKKNPKLTRKKVLSKFYRLDLVRDSLEIEIIYFINNVKPNYKEILILWDGYCRVCFKKGERCTYDSGKPCRYPDEIRFSMEAVGINVDKTVRSVGIDLEWPPVNHAYRFGLICLK